MKAYNNYVTKDMEENGKNAKRIHDIAFVPK
jgi:hypothetical protein